MTIVIKKDGAKESFDAEKIKIAVISAAIQAGFTREEASEEAERALSAVRQSVSMKEEVSTAEIKEMILNTVSTVVKEAWETYEQQK
jgi:transcriptional regulator NrdR family protein